MNSSCRAAGIIKWRPVRMRSPSCSIADGETTSSRAAANIRTGVTTVLGKLSLVAMPMARRADADQRSEIIAALGERGIDFDVLAEQTGQADADPFDLLCHLAFNAPLRTRRERAQRLKAERKDYFEKFSPEARQVLDELLEKYAEHGDAQFLLPDVLKVPPISTHGQPAEIIKLFGGPDQLRRAVNDLQGLLYGTN